MGESFGDHLISSVMPHKVLISPSIYLFPILCVFIYQRLLFINIIKGKMRRGRWSKLSFIRVSPPPQPKGSELFFAPGNCGRWIFWLPSFLWSRIGDFSTFHTPPAERGRTLHFIHQTKPDRKTDNLKLSPLLVSVKPHNGSSAFWLAQQRLVGEFISSWTWTTTCSQGN